MSESPEGTSLRPRPIARDSTSLITRGLHSPENAQAVASSQPVSGPSGDESSEQTQTLRPRRSSIAERIGSISHYGGPNSLSNFASSWRRAAGFYEVTHRGSQARLDDADESEAVPEARRSDLEQGPSRITFRRTVLGHDARKQPDHAIIDEDLGSTPTPLDVHARIAEHRRLSSASRIQSGNLSDQYQQQLDSANQVGSHGNTYGSLVSRINEPAKRQAGRLFSEQQATGTSMPDKEREPLLTKPVQAPDGNIIDVVVGQSTVPQTIFNSVNTLIGVGMLSLPLGLRYGGWVIGMIFFFLSAVSTSYTAKLLAKCLDVDHSLITFADVGFIAFGRRARVLISILFSLELLGVCIALVILFADSVDLLITGWGTTMWKVVCGLLVIPLSFLPMRFLSFTSILGILCGVLIVVAIFVDGLIKPHALGSLHEPAETYLFPADWRTLPLAFGLLMAPWGGHSVFPNLYRDMRHPQKYNKAVNYTYCFTYLLEAALAVAGYLMFGDKVRDEITSNIFLTEGGYPRGLSIVIVISIAILPLTKIPLSQRPIVATLEIFMGLDARAMSGSSSLNGMSNVTRGVLRVGIRIFVPVCFTALAIVVPSFDRIMSLLGSLACFSICIILPCSFHLKIFGKDLGMAQFILDCSLVVICSILAIIGTVCACIPKELLGAA